jgi:hypothetical protein
VADVTDFLGNLTNGAPPQNVTGSQGSISSQPDWYQQMMQGIAVRGTQLADRGYQYYSDPRLAGFTPDQQQSFGAIRGMQGQWQPGIQGAQGYVGQGQQFGQQAVNATGGPAQSWTGNWQQYMSPYTSSVVNEIGRLGNQNLQENVLHDVNDSFIGSGGFGSTRNADMIGRGIRDAQSNISGLQSQALQQGYGQAASIFGQDANRQQQQQQMQATAALGAGNLANAGASQMGALSQMGQQMGYNDVNALYGAGAQQQQLQQKGYDTGYNEFQNQANYGWNQLNNLNSMLHGMQLPTMQTGVNNGPLPGAGFGSSPLGLIATAYGTGGN